MAKETKEKEIIKEEAEEKVTETTEDIKEEAAEEQAAETSESELGYKNFVELGYIRMNRFDYDEKMVENYRNQVIKDIVPLTVELRKRQAERTGSRA